MIAMRPVELAKLVAQLPARDRVGSRPRCLLLTHGARQRVADRLTELVAPAASVSASDVWCPDGFHRPREVTLVGCDERLLDRAHQLALARWWIGARGEELVMGKRTAAGLRATRRTLPTWDLASTARAGRARVLMLGAATAHLGELVRRARTRRPRTNQGTIGPALAEATRGLDAVTPGWNLTRAPRPLAHQLAWAWKLASLGVPVMVVYVGFLHVSEAETEHAWCPERESWSVDLRSHLTHVVPAGAWGARLPIGHAWLQLVTPTTYVQLPRPCPRCGEQLRTVLYGYPGEGFDDALSSGEYVHGGCMVSDDSPELWCRRCMGEP